MLGRQLVQKASDLERERRVATVMSKSAPVGDSIEPGVKRNWPPNEPEPPEQL